MPHFPKRLIEVDLPIRRISVHARREKSIRHGHISTLHIWWARRPLAACRAVLCASLWPDPADPICPKAFIEKAKKEMIAWAMPDRKEKFSTESWNHFNAINRDNAVFDNPETLRAALYDFIADFANWDHSTDTDYLATARALTQCAHEALGGQPGTRPLVVDPFAGGGSIPLEALRVGADAFASDLNPIPVLLNKVVLEYIPKYGQRLADEVRKWGKWIKDEAEKELSVYYPKDADGSTPIAYLWARTIISEDPGQGTPPIEVPLMRSLWLSKKPNNRKALRWKRDALGKVQCETVSVTYANGKTLEVRRPTLEIFSPAKEADVEGGTVARGSATCPVTGYTTPVASVRRQLKERKGGASDSRLFCVVTTRTEEQGRNYRLPTEKDISVVAAAAVELKKRISEHTGPLSLVPDEPTPDTKGHRAVASVQLYGMDVFSDLFTPRQLLALTTLVRLSRKAGEQIRKDDDAGLAEAVVAGISITICRQTDLSNSLCGWKYDAECPVHLFGRQAIPMMWDYAESNIIGSASASFESTNDRTKASLEALTFEMKHEGQIQLASADAHPLPTDMAQCFFTDPPYYDAVPYADLSDFFYVWFKRTIGDRMPDLFSDQLTNKDKQAVVSHPNSRAERADFENKMGKAMAEGCRVLADNGIGCVVFANKTTSGWEAQLQAMIDAGWTITASWPIDTEMGSRMNAMGTASLASSVHLVVRPRIINGQGPVGDWRDVLDELPKRIRAWLPRLAEEGVVGADAIFACIGPALEIFSKFDRVEKADGTQVTLHDYLEYVWAAVSREALSSVVANADVSGFESDAMLTAMWLWTVAAGVEDSESASGGEDGEDSGEDEDAPKKALKPTGYALEYDAARKIAQGLGANMEALKSVVEVKGDTARLLPVAERTEYLFGKVRTEVSAKPKKKKESQLMLFDELTSKDTAESEMAWGEKTVTKAGETTLDRVHQAMILFASGRGEAMKRFLVDDGIGTDGNFWKLAQALSALYPTGSQEKRWVDGLLARKKGLGL